MRDTTSSDNKLQSFKQMISYLMCDDPIFPIANVTDPLAMGKLVFYFFYVLNFSFFLVEINELIKMLVTINQVL